MKKEQSEQLPRNFHPPYIVWAGKTNLQDKVFSSIIREKFRTEVIYVKLDELYQFPAGNDHILVIVNCENLECKTITKILKWHHRNSATIRNVLLNMNHEDVQKIQDVWPHISAIFHQDVTPRIFLNGLEHVMRGGLWLPRYVMEALLLAPREYEEEREEVSDAEAKGDAKLGKRELQILEKICDGYSNDEIAEKLYLSKHTIKTHLYNIYRKINVRNRVEAANWMKQSRGKRM